VGHFILETSEFFVSLSHELGRRGQCDHRLS
jgi:hypothetical protein